MFELEKTHILITKQVDANQSQIIEKEKKIAFLLDTDLNKNHLIIIFTCIQYDDVYFMYIRYDIYMSFFTLIDGNQ